MFLTRSYKIFILIFPIIFALNLRAGEFIQYLSPRPGANYVSTTTTLTIRFHEKWDESLNSSFLNIIVSGDKSGIHEGETILTDDGRTFIFKSNRKFSINEIVNVQITANLPGFIYPIDYQFLTSSADYYDDSSIEITNPSNERLNNTPIEPHATMSVINGVSVPSDFPRVTIDVLQDTTAPGRIFLANEGGSPYILIFEDDGTPYYYKRLPEYSRDFKVQPTGTLTGRIQGDVDVYFEMDSNFQIIDTLRCGNGYGTDQHEAQVLPNGNYMLIALDVQTIDMSDSVEGGSPEARVHGNHVQELDRDGNVVFEWRSWDHYSIFDAININLRSAVIDYVHMNSIAVDYDGHIVVSSRHLNEVTKINRETGEIIWRLGGKNNQFEFVNDQDSISYQHDARPVPGKENHYTIFDNGNTKSPRYSRTVEFMVDTTNMTATKVWEYRPSPDLYASAMGSIQRLPNDNSLICWAGGSRPVATEVTPDGEIVFDMRFTSSMGNYRSFRFDWSGMLKVPYLILEKYDDRITLLFNKFGDSEVMDYIIYAGLEPNPVTPIDTTSQTWIDLTDFKYNERYYLRVTARSQDSVESDFSNEVNALINFITPGENLILNGDFSDGMLFWELAVSGDAAASGAVEEGVYHLSIDTSGISELDVQLKQSEISLEQGIKYLLEFDAYADEQRTIEVNLEKAISPFDNYSRMGFSLVETTLKHFSHEFEMTDPSDFQTQLVYNCGHENIDIYFDNISVREDVSSIIGSENVQTPDNFQLFQNTPNPFNPNTIINYELRITDYVELNIYNILGKKVATLISEKQNAGIHQVEWNASEFASGVYYYRLSTDAGFVQTKKLVLLK